MEFAALFILISVTLLVLTVSARKKSGLLQFPFLAAAVCGTWFIPQAIGLQGDPSLPKGAYSVTMIYAAACIAAIWIGYKPSSLAPIRVQEISERRLVFAAGMLSLIGGVAYSQIFRISPTLNGQGLTTGIVTILYFFSKLQYFGLALALLLLLRRFSIIPLIIVLIDLNMTMGFILFGGRRGPAVEVAMIILTSFWFQRRFIPPRSFFIALAVCGMLLNQGIGEYRSTVRAVNSNTQAGQGARLPTFDEISQIEFWKGFKATITEGGFEVTNAIHTVGASWESLRLTYGAPYWNHFIFSYVPAQLVGRATKDALTIPQPDIRYETYGYKGHIGTTDTGFADSFAAFWIFGVFVFFWISRLLSRWWSLAISGSLTAQFLYATSITTAMHSITHSTQWFVAFIPYCLGIYWMVSKLALPKSADRNRFIGLHNGPHGSLRNQKLEN